MADPIEGFGTRSYFLPEEDRYRVQNELIQWKEQQGLVIGICPGTELTDRTQRDYLVVDWDEGMRSGISPNKARRI